MNHLATALICLGFALLPASVFSGDKVETAKARADKNGKTLWYDVRLVGVEGQGWASTKSPFDRLPAKAEKLVRRPVWGLSRHSAGQCVRFVTDATTLHATWTLTSPRLAMPHMPATGVSGLDLYVKTKSGRWR
ncbi:MAG: SGNH/GDSL hydrolase N-terminal domain-containing protein, partial [Planctomycetaceae bacterium]